MSELDELLRQMREIEALDRRIAGLDAEISSKETRLKELGVA